MCRSLPVLRFAVFQGIGLYEQPSARHESASLILSLIAVKTGARTWAQTAQATGPPVLSLMLIHRRCSTTLCARIHARPCGNACSLSCVSFFKSLTHLRFEREKQRLNLIVTDVKRDPPPDWHPNSRMDTIHYSIFHVLLNHITQPMGCGIHAFKAFLAASWTLAGITPQSSHPVSSYSSTTLVSARVMGSR